MKGVRISLRKKNKAKPRARRGSKEEPPFEKGGQGGFTRCQKLRRRRFVSVTLNNVSLVHVGGNRALHNISLELKTGERVAIIGPSGAGKTSLLRILTTSLRPTSGEISLLGQDPWRLKRKALRSLRARIGAIH
ncbi:MAG: ATP-binding cassette domain-containing protein, partial [Burkholderiales bacterium]|nr:ATP-binding cassette domain-containing protein [Burkholderiales bacterium]